MHLNLLIKLFVLSFFLLIQAEYCFSQKQKDTVFLTNGSIIVGEIKNIKLGVITFDPDDANEITIQLRKLKSVYAASKVFHIETIEDILYFGTLIPYNKNKYVALVHGSDT